MGLDGQKRAALKKAKQTGGKSKKAKESITAIEAEYNSKETEIKQRHETEIKNLNSSLPPQENEQHPQKEETDPSITPIEQNQPKKLSKSQKKRQKQKEREAA